MHKFASAAIAAALVGVMAIPAPAVAQQGRAQFNSQDRFINERCSDNPRLRGCSDWRRNHQRWDRDNYSSWYRWNQPSLGGIAAGIFGFAIGSAIANSANDRYDRGSSSWERHVDACEDRYRSYDARTDMFLGYDGQYHRCNL